MNLGEVKTQFTGLFNRTDLSAKPALVTTFINQAILRIQRELRGPLNEKTLVAGIGTTYKGLIIPGDYLELKALMVDTDGDGLFDDQLETDQLQRVLRLAQSSGIPRKYTREGGKWFLGPKPLAGSQVRIDYYAEFPALANDSASNMLTKAGWDLLVNAACVCAATYYKDARKDGFNNDYGVILEDMQEQADNDEIGGGAAVAPAYHIPED